MKIRNYSGFLRRFFLLLNCVGSPFLKASSLPVEEEKENELLKSSLYAVPRECKQYLEVLVEPQTPILVLGGTRQAEYAYPKNAFLANFDENALCDLPHIDVTKPEDFPAQLEGKFEVVIWEFIDMPLFFKAESFSTIYKATAKGGMFISNFPLLIDDITLTRTPGIIKHNLSEQTSIKGLYRNKNKNQSHRLYYDLNEYDFGGITDFKSITEFNQQIAELNSKLEFSQEDNKTSITKIVQQKTKQRGLPSLSSGNKPNIIAQSPMVTSSTVSVSQPKPMLTMDQINQIESQKQVLVEARKGEIKKLKDKINKKVTDDVIRVLVHPMFEKSGFSKPEWILKRPHYYWFSGNCNDGYFVAKKLSN